MAITLNQKQAAAHCGIGVQRFRKVCRQGRGPRVWNPLDGLPRYVDTVLDEWMHARDDRHLNKANAIDVTA